MKKKIVALLAVLLGVFSLGGCMEYDTSKDAQQTIAVGNELAGNQPTPTDIDYSLERYNLIRRAYWVNGQREKAMSLPCSITKPLGYAVLITESGAVLGNFVVDGKVSSLNSYLTPDSLYYEIDNDGAYRDNKWLPDVDGSYGSNDNGIFFFTPDGKYIEWTGTYLYSDIPFTIDDPVLKLS
jgi:hypothetical protein